LRRTEGWRKIAAVLSPAHGGHGMMIIRVAVAAALALGLFSVTLAAEAQQAGKVVRIGLLDYAGPDPASAARWEAFRERSRELGYVEGQNVIFEPRWGDGHAGRLRTLAAELVHAKVDILVTAGSEAALAAKQVTNSIPIVMATGGDPVELGLATGLGRPGGNVTGVISLIGQLTWSSSSS
jgi:putative ABC transport system substrate-binding protein